MQILAAQRWLAALSAPDFRVAIIILQAAVDGMFHPTRDLWEATGVNRTAALRSLANLASLNLITSVGRGNWQLSAQLSRAARPADDDRKSRGATGSQQESPGAGEIATDVAPRDLRAVCVGILSKRDITTKGPEQTDSAPLVDQGRTTPSQTKGGRAKTRQIDSGATGRPGLSTVDVAPRSQPADPDAAQMDLFQVDRVRPVEPVHKPIKRRESAEQRRARVEKAPIDPDLIAWATWWNSMAKRRIVKHEVKLPPRMELRLAWDVAQSVADLREILQISNQPKLEQCLLDADAYGSGWWTFAKFLGAKMADRVAWKLTALFDGGYAYAGNKPRTAVPIISNTGTASRRLAAGGIQSGSSVAVAGPGR